MCVRGCRSAQQHVVSAAVWGAREGRCSAIAVALAVAGKRLAREPDALGCAVIEELVDDALAESDVLARGLGECTDGVGRAVDVEQHVDRRTCRRTVGARGGGGEQGTRLWRPGLRE